MAGPIILGGHLDLDCGDSIAKVDLVPIQRVIGIRDSGVVFVKELECGIVAVGGDYRNPQLARLRGVVRNARFELRGQCPRGDSETAQQDVAEWQTQTRQVIGCNVSQTFGDAPVQLILR